MKTKPFLRVLAVLSLAGLLASCVMSKSAFEYYKEQYRIHPEWKLDFAAECWDKYSDKELTALAKHYGVAKNRGSYVLCHRLIEGIMSDKISYEDYIAFRTGKKASPQAYRLLFGK